MSELLKHALTPLLSDEEAMAFVLEAFEERSLVKGEVFFRAEQVVNEIAWIRKGSMKMSYLKDGKEHIGDFMVEGEFVTDIVSFGMQIPSRLYLTALEDCELFVFTRENMLEGERRFPEAFMRLNRLTSERNAIIFANRIWSTLIDSPEERYEQLLTEKPHWFQRFPLYMIASYLGVTPEGLSKIRRRRR